MGQSGGKMPGNLQLAKGEPRPKGCCESPKGGEVNFTIDAPGRGSVWLYLLLPEGHEGASTLEGVDSSGGELYVQLDPSTNKTGDTWHVKLTLPGGFDPKGAKYMWILDPKLDQHGLPEANAVRILDPCAKCLDSRYAKDWNKRGGPKFSPMAVVPDRRAIYEFDWQGVKPPNLHLKDLVIYEAHVRGFTRNPDSKLQDWDATAGTFLGFIQKIPHLLKLGINAVELLPVYEFDETACPRKNPENGEQLCNFWGYSTVNFFVPMQRFSSRDRIGAAIVGFKTLVRELHRQGIEVILDVVFNHTAEGAWGEHFWHSWAAIAKNRYYILSNGQDTNYTGCGNTVNANDPMCSDWIVECLSYWVDEMHVDGFRFDLASALTRGNDGKVSMDPLLIKKMANEPKLKRAKFIAEAWDCSWPDGYLVGKFPSGGPPRWAEWNGIFRDTIRCFIKGDEGKKGDFATRICGSSDLFKHNGRKPFHSINFITAHDGFTLKDLVSYNGKHNTCNGENSGDDHNNSWNCGHEGDTGDGGVNHLRSRQIRNFMVALFMSAGTPMILYGDEYGRSQRGCNNGWCQDARCWFSWSDSEKQENNLMRFVRLLISLRKQYAGIFNREEFMSNKDIWWRVHWDDPYNYICYVLHDHHATGQGYAGLMVAFNAGHEVRCCDLPQDKPWYRIIDTNLPAPKDICENEASSVKITSQSYVMQPYSCIVLKTYSDKKSIKEYARTDAEYGAHQDINRHMKEVIKRRMSMEFTSSTGTPHIQDIGKRQSNEAMERMQSMVRMRSLMSGAFMDAIEEGESLSETKWGHMTLMHRYNNCRDMIQTWSSRSNTGEAAMRRMPSWSATFNKDALRRASWSRLPSASLLIDPEEEKSEEQDDELWSWIFVWQRFSFMRLLDWQRNYNTKPRELAGATDSLANKICSVWKEYPNIRLWARWTLATIGRGGNQGQAIRDEILHIMHRNKIPETKGHFYEEWHQKLHNNTTPDDVGICKALLAFLRTGGKMEEYWKVLHDHGITKERLASYERSITKEPYMHGDAGRLIMEFENYLRILQSVHDALDLKTAIDAAKSCLPKQVMDQLQEISGSDAKMKRSRSLGSLDKDSQEKSHQRFMKLAEARLGILGILNDSKTDVGVIRQLLLLDYSLETQQSVIAQGNTDETRLPTLCEQMKAFLTSVVGHIPLHGELRALLVDWTQLAPECANLKFGAGPAESALMLKALCDRLARVVGEQVDTFQTLLAPKATTLGQAVGVEKNVLEVFVDEVLRGSALFALSLILKRLEPQLRSIAQLPPWQMISAVDHPVQGELVSVPRMLHMQDKIFETPTIMLSGLVSGEEEVPVGVQAVLVRDAKSAPDILSHCAVRARNSGVLLASCYDSTLTEKIEAELLGQWVQVVCSADGSVEIKAAERPMADPKRMRMMARSASRDLTQELMSKETDSTKLVNMNLKEDFGCKWVVTPEKMDKSKVGSKSLNLALLKPQLPKDILTPQAVAMPYGSMQKALTSRENAKEWLSKLEACLAQLQPTSSNEDAKTIFQEAQVYVNALQMPSELDQALRSAMEEVGSKEGEKRLLNLYHRGDAWDATKQVWASLFGLRPWVSLAKAGRSFYDLNMAVLVQELLPAKYAFVLHTKNPFTNDPNEVYGEVVPGRGETLVGNYPGRALSFRARKGETPVVTSFLSKSTLLRTQECLIFRSDSNGEDLEGFAGAGLFESICATSDIPCMVRFHRLRLLTDHSFRQTLLSKLAEAGRAVEKAFGSPQDIEGCVDPQDRIFIVQSRPQV
ncbi:unnamed protein product [Effrenium voratum]|uniref:Glycosyl hydrolase family 13 catalytic domain-containing protein n=1 Tax=Effrenium voratum TaxID=2562239 RepID=A0AA36NJZ5_9DINO|nr:unnamed protein product [Effrenium voratum]